MSSQWLDEMSNKVKEIRSIAIEMHLLSEAFGVIGNRELSERLFDIGDDLDRISKEIHEETGKKIMSDLGESQSSFFKAMSGAMDILNDEGNE